MKKGEVGIVIDVIAETKRMMKNNVKEMPVKNLQNVKNKMGTIFGIVMDVIAETKRMIKKNVKDKDAMVLENVEVFLMMKTKFLSRNYANKLLN